MKDKNLSEEGKEKKQKNPDNMGVNDIKISLKIGNKDWLSIEKTFFKKCKNALR